MKAFLDFQFKVWEKLNTHSSYLWREKFMKLFLNYHDICQILNCKRSKAYIIIRDLNKELESAGMIVYNGKVSLSYFCERYGLDESKVESVLLNS